MRRAAWFIGVLSLVGAALLAVPAVAATAPRCGEAMPTATYDVSRMTSTIAVPLAPCRSHGQAVRLGVQLSITRCEPILGCAFPVNGWTHCVGKSGSCVLVVRAPHPSVEVANYYVSAHVEAFSGEDVDQLTIDRTNGLPCVSAAVKANC